MKSVMKYLFGVTYEKLSLNYVKFSVCVCDRIRHFSLVLSMENENLLEYLNYGKCVYILT